MAMSFWSAVSAASLINLRTRGDISLLAGGESERTFSPPCASRSHSLGYFSSGHREKGQTAVSFLVWQGWWRRRGKKPRGSREGQGHARAQKGWKHDSTTARMENPQMERTPPFCSSHPRSHFDGYFPLLNKKKTSDFGRMKRKRERERERERKRDVSNAISRDDVRMSVVFHVAVLLVASLCSPTCNRVTISWVLFVILEGDWPLPGLTALFCRKFAPKLAIYSVFLFLLMSFSSFRFGN